MKHKYSVFKKILGVQIVCILALKAIGISANDCLGSFLCSLFPNVRIDLMERIASCLLSWVFFSPEIIWLFLLGRDFDISSQKRYFSNLFAWFILISLILGSVFSFLGG